MQPIHDRIIVRPSNKEDKTPGGIHIPNSVESVTRIGFVLFVGPGAPDPAVGGLRRMQVKPGDTIIFGKYSGAEVVIPGEEKPVLVMREDDVFAIVERERPIGPVTTSVR